MVPILRLLLFDLYLIFNKYFPNVNLIYFSCFLNSHLINKSHINLPNSIHNQTSTPYLNDNTGYLHCSPQAMPL